ncbi:MAG: hypothetical protein ACRET4_15620, partial [Steroidobacteraceae bacterium]
KQVSATTGDRLVMMIGETDVDPRTPVQIVFSRPIYGGGSTDANAIDSYLATVIKLHRAPKAFPTAYTEAVGVHFRLDSDARRVTIELPSELERGAHYWIELSDKLAAAGADGPGLKLGQTGPNAPASSMSLFFNVRDVPDPIASFQVPSGSIRDLTLNGNVLLMSAGTGGILAYDAANPGNPLPIGHVNAGSTDFWAVASDHHGRVYATGTDNAFGFVQSYRLEDFIGTPANPKVITTPRASAVVCWIPGYSSGLDLSSDTVLSDRPEGLPRKLQIASQDDELRYSSLDEFAAAVPALGSVSAPVVQSDGSKRLTVTIKRQRRDDFKYAGQRITIENLTRGLRWSADAADGTPAAFDILARPSDQLRIVYNLSTYGIVTIFGYGVGVFDLNAMESNDTPGRTTAALSEVVRITSAAQLANCETPSASAIADYTFSPEIAVVPQGVSGKLALYGADVRKGLLDVNIELGTEAATTSGPVCDERAPLGLLLSPDANPRINALAAAFTQRAGRAPFARFGAVQPYVANGKTYLLLSGYELGVLVIDSTRPPGWLDASSLADIVWIPGGAVALRVIPGTHFATVVDAQGRVLLVDLSDIDERASAAPNELFPTVSKALQGSGSYGFGAADPRILWTSDPGLVSGSLAPVIDPDTGMLYGSQLQGIDTKVVAARDPHVRVVIRKANGELIEVSAVIPLGVAPAATIVLKPEDLAGGAFRIEVILPGGITDAVPNLSFAIDSERVPGAASEDTPQPLPRAHLNVVLHRDLPSDPAILAGLRNQSGFNHFVSDWIVAVADPRAAKGYTWPAGADKAAAGCASCDRPAWLPADAQEIYTLGRSLKIAPAASLFTGAYAYLGQAGRMETRIATVPADTVRPTSVLVAAQ